MQLSVKGKSLNSEHTDGSVVFVILNVYLLLVTQTHFLMQLYNGIIPDTLKKEKKKMQTGFALELSVGDEECRMNGRKQNKLP